MSSTSRAVIKLNTSKSSGYFHCYAHSLSYAQLGLCARAVCAVHTLTTGFIPLAVTAKRKWSYFAAVNEKIANCVGRLFTTVAKPQTYLKTNKHEKENTELQQRRKEEEKEGKCLIRTQTVDTVHLFREVGNIQVYTVKLLL